MDISCFYIKLIMKSIKIKTQKATIATFAMVAFYSYPVQYPECKFQI